MVDESHLTVTAASYRSSLVEVTALRSLGTQFVYLTATLPPSTLSECQERKYLNPPDGHSSVESRPNIMYMVERTKSAKASLLEQAAARRSRRLGAIGPARPCSRQNHPLRPLRSGSRGPG